MVGECCVNMKDYLELLCLETPFSEMVLKLLGLSPEHTPDGLVHLAHGIIFFRSGR